MTAIVQYLATFDTGVVSGCVEIEDPATAFHAGIWIKRDGTIPDQGERAEILVPPHRIGYIEAIPLNYVTD